MHLGKASKQTAVNVCFDQGWYTEHLKKNLKVYILLRANLTFVITSNAEVILEPASIAGHLFDIFSYLILIKDGASCD